VITVSSCGVKVQEVLSGLDKEAKTMDIHMHFCGSFQHSLLFFLSTWGVTIEKQVSGKIQERGYT